MGSGVDGIQGGTETMGVCLAGGLTIARGFTGGHHRVIVVWGVGLMQRKEDLKQLVSAFQGELDDSKRAYRWIFIHSN